MKQLILENIEDKIYQKTFDLVSFYVKNRKDIKFENHLVKNLGWKIKKFEIEKQIGSRLLILVITINRSTKIFYTDEDDDTIECYFNEFTDYGIMLLFKKALNNLKFYGISSVHIHCSFRDGSPSKFIFIKFN